MKTILTIIILSTALIACAPKAQPSDIMVKNVYGQIVTWKTFPVVFSFHQNFPQDKREIVKIEITKFNIIAGAEVFKISDTITTKVQPKENSKDGVNTLYWDFNQAFRMQPSEQGKASVFWVGTDIIESDINLQSSFLPQVDFATLIRHELLHTLGLSHSHFDLMNTHLAAYTTKEWDKDLITQWRSEINTYAQVKLPVLGSDSLASK